MLGGMSLLLGATAVAAQSRYTVGCTEVGTLQKGHIGVAGPFVGWVGKGQLMLAGGANFPEKMPWEGGTKVYSTALWTCTEADGQWQCVESTQAWPEPIAYGASVQTPQGLVCIGGEGTNGATNHVWRVSSGSEGHSLNIDNLPPLPNPLTNIGAAAVGNAVYVVGGECNGQPQQAVYRLHLGRLHKGWERLADLPLPTSHAVVVGKGRGKHRRLYVIGGRAKTASGISDLYRAVYALHAQAGHWTEEVSLLHPLAAAAGIIDPSGRWIYVLGGDVGDTFHQVEQHLVAIGTTTDPTRKAELIAAKNKLQIEHPGFNRTIWRYDTRQMIWQNMGDMRVAAPVSTTAVWWGEKILLSSGEIRPGVRTPRLLAIEINTIMH